MRSNASDYPLTGRVRCGKAYLGAAAHGRSERYQRASAADLDALRGELHAALEDGAPTRVKAMLQA